MKSFGAIFFAGLLLLASAAKVAAGWTDGGVSICNSAREQRNPVAVPDGAGGVIIAWEDNRGYFSWDLYAQRVSSTGETLWAVNGVPVCIASLDQIDARIMTDGSGGAFIAWTDYRNGTNNRDVYIQRLSSEGEPLWAADGVAVCAEAGHQYASEIATDDSSGVIAAWLDTRGTNDDIYAQRISGTGEILWDSAGVFIAGGNNARLQILADGSGGAIIVREEADLYAQRVSRSGIVQWKANGITVCSAGGNQSRPQLVSDGAGGAIIDWMDFRAFAWDIFAQRISASGEVLWVPNNGIVICAAENDQTVPRLVSDGAGGAIIAWMDARAGDLDVYAARVSGGGVRIWPGQVVPICTAPLAQQTVEIAPDGAGGAIIGWTDGRAGVNDIYCQRISAAGTALWTIDGVPVCAESGDQDEPKIVSDGYGGAIAAWRDARISPPDIYAQKIRFNGAITAVGENRIPAIRAELLPLSPNPFGGELHIDFIVDAPGDAAVKVFDVNGRLVRDLGCPRFPVGRQSLLWDCRDRSGRRVRSGIYFIRLETAAGAIARKAVMLE